jgi:hypothetical protein
MVDRSLRQLIQGLDLIYSVSGQGTTAPRSWQWRPQPSCTCAQLQRCAIRRAPHLCGRCSSSAT